MSKHYIDRQVTDPLDRLGPVPGLAHHLDIGFLTEGRPQPVVDDRMVVHDQQPDPSARRAHGPGLSKGGRRASLFAFRWYRWDAHCDHGALTGSALDLQGATRPAHPLPHRLQAEVVSRGRAERSGSASGRRTRRLLPDPE
jgi:hypothetical protein